MPAPPSWLPALPDAVAQLEAFQPRVVTRQDLQDLLGVSRSRAAQLMRAFGADLVGGIRQIPREDLIARFRAYAATGAFAVEERRRGSVVQQLRQARLAKLRVRVPVEVLQTTLRGLPAGVTVESRRIEAPSAPRRRLSSASLPLRRRSRATTRRSRISLVVGLVGRARLLVC